MEYGDQIKLSNGLIGTLISVHGNGSLQIRINRGQHGAGQMISASQEDVEILESELDKEFEQEPTHNTQTNMSQTSTKGILVGIGIVFIVGLAIWMGNGNKKQDDQIYILTQQLNQYNNDDIQDIGACKRMKERDKKKKDILMKIDSLK